MLAKVYSIYYIDSKWYLLFIYTYFRCLVQPESEAKDNPDPSFRNILEDAIRDSENLDEDETSTRADSLIDEIFTSNQSYLRLQFAFENYSKSTEELILLYAKYEGQPTKKDQIKSSKMEQTLVEFSVTYDNELITIQETGFIAENYTTKTTVY